MVGTVIVGFGLTVILKFWGVPGQPFRVGVTTKLPVNGVLPVFVVVKLISPLPVADRPMLALEFVQFIVAEEVPMKFTVTIAPAQTL